jgi:catechol 2,3-dioxygenase-like lactoylglutathione lyase family enzyme
VAIEELAINFENKPLPEKASAYLAEANLRIDRLFETERNKHMPRFIPSDAIAIYNALDFITREDFPLGRVYCEWGSGYGIGSCFAAMLGYEAYGIEIEADFRWPNGARSLYFRDPAGNSVELADPAIWG